MKGRMLVMAAIAAATPLAAKSQGTVETTPVVAVGDTVRVWAPNPRLEGAMAMFTRVNATELVIAGQSANPSAPPREIAIPLASVTRMDILRSNGRSKGRMVKGIVIGALAGAALGASLVPFIECGGACDKDGPLKPKAARRIGGIAGGGIGAVLGGVIGGTSRARWETVTFTVR